MADVVHAFMESPQWKRGALFIVYDEWGGFFDHVAPPRVPDPRNDPDINKDYGLMGFRIPARRLALRCAAAMSRTRRFGFESILKMICYRFGLKPLNRRDAYAKNIARAFDWRASRASRRRTCRGPSHVVCRPCASGGDARGARRTTT